MKTSHTDVRIKKYASPTLWPQIPYTFFSLLLLFLTSRFVLRDQTCLKATSKTWRERPRPWMQTAGSTLEISANGCLYVHNFQQSNCCIICRHIDFQPVISSRTARWRLSTGKSTYSSWHKGNTSLLRRSRTSTLGVNLWHSSTFTEIVSR